MNHRPVVSLILVSLTYLPYLPYVRSFAFGDRLVLKRKWRDVEYRRRREAWSSGYGGRQHLCPKRTADGSGQSLGAFLKTCMSWPVKSLRAVVA